MNKKFTPENISHLESNEVFVFGSNLQGSHGGGAARVAHKLFGAEMGHGVGLQGQSYAIPTMQGGVETIKPYVDEFTEFAKDHPELTFYVTRIGCGIAGFKDEQIAPLFDKVFDLKNVILPKEFWHIINHAHCLASETANMVFHSVPIKFSDEDIAKMEGMSADEKSKFVISLKQQGKYTVVHDSPEEEYSGKLLNCTEKGYHKIGITEKSFAIVAGSKLYSDQYEWGLDFEQNILSVIANDSRPDNYIYGQFIVLLKDGSIKEIWSEQCINDLFCESDFVSVASGCGGLVFGLRQDGTVAVCNSEKNPRVAKDVVEWSDIKQIDAGRSHVVGLKADGSVVASGKESVCKPLQEWHNISRVYVPKSSSEDEASNNLTFGIQKPHGWLLVDGDLWEKDHEFFKRIRAQYDVMDVVGDSDALWVRTWDNIVRCIFSHNPMETYHERCFISQYPEFRFMDKFLSKYVLVDKEGEFRVFKDDKEVSWHH